MRLLRALAMTFLVTFALLGVSTAVAQSAPAPQVTTREEAGSTIREYRINGQLYAIEIRPADGAAYHLLDRDGKGNFTRMSGTDIQVPGWVTR